MTEHNNRYTINPHGIPDELREREQWVNWEYRNKDGKETKVPLSPYHGALCNPQEPENWASFETVFGNAQRNGVGIGYVLSINDPYTVVDLDDPLKAKADAKAVDAMQSGVMAELNTWTEISNSGRGYHCWVKNANVPKNGVKTSKHNIEVYSAGRYIAVTGNTHPNAPAFIQNGGHAGEVVGVIHRAIDRTDGTDVTDIQQKQPTGKHPHLLLDEICAWENGENFRRLALTAPKDDDSADESGIDQAVMNWIVHACGNIDEALAAFAETSRAKRDKWRNRSDYRMRTVRRAFDKLAGVPPVTLGESLMRALADTCAPKGACEQLVSAAMAVDSVGTTYKDPPKPRCTLAEMLADKDSENPHEFIVEKLVPVHEVTHVAGHGAVGKTTLAAQMLASVSVGVPFFGHACEPAPVLLVSGEDRRNQITRVMRRIIREMDRHRLSSYDVANDIASNFHFIQALGDSLWREDRSDIEGVPTQFFFRLEREIRETKARLVVLDNMSGMFRGNDNDKNQVYAFITALRMVAERTNCAIVTLGHVGAANAGGENSKTYFGSGAWHNASRSRISLELVRSDSKDADHVIVKHEKTNYGEYSPHFKLRRNDEGVFVSLTADEEKKQAETVVANDDAQLLEMIRRCVDIGQPLGAAATGPVTMWHGLIAADPKTYREKDKGLKQRMNTARSRLESSNSIFVGTIAGKEHSRDKKVLVPAGYSRIGMNRYIAPS